MNRRSISLAAGLLGVGVAVIMAGEASRADQSDEDKIKAAIAAYNVAISSLDVSQMDGLWAHEAYVMSIQPRDKAVSVGWDAVRSAWQATFSFWDELKVTSTGEPHIRIDGNVAWSDNVVMVVGRSRSGDRIEVPTFASDVFEKRADAWLLVSHNAWRVPK